MIAIGTTTAIAPTTTRPGRPPMKDGTYDVHVVPKGVYWAVKSEHHDEYQGWFTTQLEATAYGMHLAKESGASLLIHRKDGTISKVWNYKNYAGPDLGIDALKGALLVA